MQALYLRPGVKPDIPDVHDGNVTDDSGSSSSQDEAPDDFVYQDDDPNDPNDDDPAGDPSAAQPRESRLEPFGPFTVSKIVANGIDKGWGANCRRHWDCRSSLSCKKSITTSDLTPESLDECLRLCKKWLLMGTLITGIQ